MQPLFFILGILCSTKILKVFGKCRPSGYLISSCRLSGHVMFTMIVSSLSEYVTMYVTEMHCKRLDFRLKGKSCDLNETGKHAHPKDYGPKAGFIYMDVSESSKVCPFHAFPMLVRLIAKKIYIVMIYLYFTLSLSLSLFGKINMLGSILNSSSSLDTKNKRYIFSFIFSFKLRTPAKVFFYYYFFFICFQSCAVIQLEWPQVESEYHWITIGSREVQVYCDMTNNGKPQVK